MMGDDLWVQENGNGADVETLHPDDVMALVSASRLLMARALQGQTAYHGDRDYYEVLGYPEAIDASTYAQRYSRQDIASRVIDLPAIDSWKNPPPIVDGKDDSDRDPTEFETAWEELDKRMKVWNVLSRADRLSGIGRFGIIILGMRDGAEDMAGEVSLDETRAFGPKGLLYMRPLSEEHVEIKTIEKDHQSERFGLPTMYHVTLEEEEGTDIGSFDIHWTRVLHLAENKLDSMIYGRPRLQSVFNRLDDLMKVVGGTSEATWLNMRPGIGVGPEDGYKWEDTDAKKREWLEEIWRYAHDPLRIMRMVGLKATPLGTAQIMDPAPPFEVLIALISAATGIPQRVLMGTAKGELASAREDTRQWASFISNRQKTYAEPEVLRPFITRMIKYGVLPLPAMGLDGYNVGTMNQDGVWSWPSIIELAVDEENDAMKAKAQAAQALMDPLEQTLPITLEEQRELLGYPTENTLVEPLLPEGFPEIPGLDLEDTETLSLYKTALQRYRAGEVTSDQIVELFQAARERGVIE